MQIAVVIPFRGDPATLQWSLEGFARQELPPQAMMEVRVCGDGVELPAMPEVAAEQRGRIRFSGTSSPRVGVAEAKNILLRDKPTDVVIFCNSDTRPVPGFAAAHCARLISLPPGHMVLGSSPYETAAAGPTVFDLLKSDSPMIFFYNQMAPHGRYDFRHGWSLNLSARYADLERIGFFDPRYRPYGNEDLDLSFRMMGSRGKRIYFDPAAEVIHRHPMSFEDYLNREELLGLMAPVLYDISPDMFEALYATRDVAALAEQFRQWIAMDRAGHSWIYRRMQEWNPLPAKTLGPEPHRSRLLMTLYQMHIPLKRLSFRLGFLRGLELRNDAHWQERIATGLWRTAMGLK